MKRMKRIIFAAIISLTCLFTAISKPSISSPFTTNYTVESVGKDPGATPEVVKSRLAALNTSLEMRYDSDVQSYIDRYIKNGRKQLTNLLMLSSYYMPIFEEALRKAGLPEELKYLPVIESSLKAEATSPVGAAGLWQIMAGTAKGYDMKIDGSIDERRDPYLSSERACRILKKQYERFGDWGLAIAAYNCGSGTMSKALKRAGGDPKQHNFWTVYNYLPAQTRHYVPKFIAINYVMNYYQEHDVPEVEVSKFTTDTVHISSKTSLSKVASMVEISKEELRKLNPHFKGDVIPATASRHCNLILPTATAREYKVKMGRNPETPAVAAQSETPAVKVNGQKDQKQRRFNPNYRDVPSTTMPNTYVRVLNKEFSSKDLRKREEDGKE